MFKKKVEPNVICRKIHGTYIIKHIREKCVPQNEIGGGRTMHEHRSDSHFELSFFLHGVGLEFNSLNVIMLELSLEIMLGICRMPNFE